MGWDIDLFGSLSDDDTVTNSFDNDMGGASASPAVTPTTQPEPVQPTPYEFQAEDMAPFLMNEYSDLTQVKDVAKDTGISALKGAIGVGEAIQGLLNIPSGGHFGYLTEKLGYDPEAAKDILNTFYSESYQQAQGEVEQAKGFGNTLKAMAKHPSTIYHGIVETLPAMGAGGVAGRGVQAALKASPVLAGALGEAAVSMGQASENIRQQAEDGTGGYKGSAAAIGTGIGTAIFGVAGGRLAAKLGVDDVETMLVKMGTNKSPQNVVAAIAKGGISEGAFEELPQSVQETIWANAALDKPLLEGVPESAAAGLVTGSTMGGAVAGGATTRSPIQQVPSAEEALKILEDGGIVEPPQNVDDRQMAQVPSAIDAVNKALPPNVGTEVVPPTEVTPTEPAATQPTLEGPVPGPVQGPTEAPLMERSLEAPQPTQPTQAPTDQQETQGVQQPEQVDQTGPQEGTTPVPQQPTALDPTQVAIQEGEQRMAQTETPVAPEPEDYPQEMYDAIKEDEPAQYQKIMDYFGKDINKPLTGFVRLVRDGGLRDSVIEKVQRITGKEEKNLAQAAVKVGHTTFKNIVYDTVKENRQTLIREKEGLLNPIKQQDTGPTLDDTGATIEERGETPLTLDDYSILEDTQEDTGRTKDTLYPSPSPSTPHILSIFADEMPSDFVPSTRKELDDAAKTAEDRLTERIRQNQSDVDMPESSQIEPSDELKELEATLTMRDDENALEGQFQGKSEAQEEVKQRARQRTQEKFDEVDRVLKENEGIEGGKTAVKDATKAGRRWAKEGLLSATEVLRDIHPKLMAYMKRFEHAVNVKTKDRQGRIEDFKTQYLNMSKPDQEKLKVALLNRNHGNFNLYLKEDLSPEVASALEKVDGVLKDMEREFMAYGLINKGRKRYFPNRVKNIEDLMTYMDEERGKGKIALEIRKITGQDPTKEEVKQVIRGLLEQGTYPGMFMLPKSAKARSIWEITPEMSKFYFDPIEALEAHVREGTEAIEQRKVIGSSRRAKIEERAEKLYWKKGKTEDEQLELERLNDALTAAKLDDEADIASWMAEQIEMDNLSPADQQLAKDVFKARFNQKATSKFLGMAKDLSLASALGQFGSTIVQLGDLPHIIAKRGWSNAFSALLGPKMYSKDDMDVHAFIKDLGGSQTTSKILETVLKMTGFDKVDGFFKATTMQAAINQAAKMDFKEFEKKWGYMYGDETAKLHADLKKGKLNDLTREFAFIELTETQPVTPSEMPIKYMKGGNWRILYALKSYNLKALNNIRRDVKQANREGGAGKAMKTLASYVTLLTLAGAGSDAIKDMLMGNDVNWGESIADNVMKLFLLSRYNMGKVVQGDVADTLMGFFAPPLGMIEKPIEDLYNAIVDDRQSEWKTVQEIPIIGKIAWSRFSDAAEKRRMRDDRDEVFALLKKMTQEGTTKDMPRFRKLQREYNKKAKKHGLKPITYETVKRNRKRYRREAKKEQAGKGLADVLAAVGPKEAYAQQADDISQGMDPEWKKEYEVNKKRTEARMAREALGSKLRKDYGETPEEKRKAVASTIKEESILPKETAKFLEKVEGLERTVYVPKSKGKVLGKSGATVASGFDIGQRASLDRYKFSPKLESKLIPYLGKKGAEAEAYVKANPLTLSLPEVREINRKVKYYEAKKVAEAYEADSGRDWNDLNTAAKTAIISVAFQHGLAGTRKYNFWRQALDMEWGKMYDNLRNWGSYQTRRNKEARLLKDSGLV